MFDILAQIQPADIVQPADIAPPAQLIEYSTIYLATLSLLVIAIIALVSLIANLCMAIRLRKKKDDLRWWRDNSSSHFENYQKGRAELESAQESLRITKQHVEKLTYDRDTLKYDNARLRDKCNNLVQQYVNVNSAVDGILKNIEVINENIDHISGDMFESRAEDDEYDDVRNDTRDNADGGDMRAVYMA